MHEPIQTFKLQFFNNLEIVYSDIYKHMLQFFKGDKVANFDQLAVVPNLLAVLIVMTDKAQGIKFLESFKGDLKILANFIIVF